VAEEEPVRTPQGEAAAAETLQAAGDAPASLSSDVDGTTLAGLVALSAVVSLPAAWRAARARRRWAQVSANPASWPEVAWAELGDGVIDLRRPWERSTTPRSAGRALRPLLHDKAALDALDRLVRGVERSRFAAAASATGRESEAAATTARADVERILEEMADGRSRTQRRLARWLPRSIWVRSRPTWLSGWSRTRLRQA
jgi:hypothetical protein